MPYRFQGQHKDEEVVLICRQHPMILLRPALIVVALMWVPFLAYTVLAVGQLLAVILLFCLLLALGEGYRAWHAWHNSMLLLTNERLVMMEQRHLFKREFMECALGSIQQVSHTVEGVVATTFGFGTLSVFTAGAHDPFQLRNIPNPYELQQEIQRVGSGEGYIEEGDAPSEQE